MYTRRATEARTEGRGEGERRNERWMTDTAYVRCDKYVCHWGLSTATNAGWVGVVEIDA